MALPLLPLALLAGAGAGGYALYKHGVFQPKGQATGTAPQGVSPGLVSVGDRILANTVQPNGSQAHLSFVVRGVSGSTLTVTPADDPPMDPSWGIVYPPTIQVADVIQQLPKLPQFAGRGTAYPPGYNAPQGWGQHQFGGHGAGARYDSHGYTLGGHGYGRANALAPYGYGRGGGYARAGEPGYAPSWHSGASSERWPYGGRQAGLVPDPQFPYGPRQGARMGAIDLVGGRGMGPNSFAEKAVVGAKRNPWLKTMAKFSGGYDRPYGPENDKLIVGSDDPIMNKHIRRGKTQGRGW